MKNVQDIFMLQTEFMRAQMQAVAEQAKNLSETTTKAMMDGLKSPSKGGLCVLILELGFLARVAPRQRGAVALHSGMTGGIISECPGRRLPAGAALVRASVSKRYRNIRLEHESACVFA